MTDPAPQSSDSVSARRVIRRRRALCLLVGLALCGLTGYWSYLRVTERSRVLAAITAAGGKYFELPALQRVAHSLLLVFGKHSGAGDFVLLDGSKFDDAWLAAQHDLRSLQIRDLTLRDTRVTREAVLRLLQRQEPSDLMAPGIPLTDADAVLIGRLEHLTFLNLAQSELTDAGFAALKPERLLSLNVAGTRVTSNAIQQALTRNHKILFVTLDGRQFTPELASTLAQSKSIKGITLIGPDVTDAHIKLLETLQNIRDLRIEQTTVSETAVAALRAARPQPGAVDVPGPDDIFYRWRPE